MIDFAIRQKVFQCPNPRIRHCGFAKIQPPEMLEGLLCLSGDKYQPSLGVQGNYESCLVFGVTGHISQINEVAPVPGVFKPRDHFHALDEYY